MNRPPPVVGPKCGLTIRPCKKKPGCRGRFWIDSKHSPLLQGLGHFVYGDVAIDQGAPGIAGKGDVRVRLRSGEHWKQRSDSTRLRPYIHAR